MPLEEKLKVDKMSTHMSNLSTCITKGHTTELNVCFAGLSERVTAFLFTLFTVQRKQHEPSRALQA